MKMETLKASDVKVGDVVEFEKDSPVTVLEIEPNYGEGDFNPAPWKDQEFGKSLVFPCCFGEPDSINTVHTFYVRRELSPISGDRVVR